MAKDGKICFHRRPFANPIKPQRCTTEPVGPLDGINKDVGGAKLLLHNNHLCMSSGLCVLCLLLITVPLSVLMKAEAVTCL